MSFLHFTPVHDSTRYSLFDRYFGFDDHDDFDLFFDTLQDAFWNRKKARTNYTNHTNQTRQQLHDRMHNANVNRSQDPHGSANNKNTADDTITIVNSANTVSPGSQLSFSAMMGMGGLLSADLVETKETFEIHADVPGVDPSDLEITIEEPRTLVIRAERKRNYPSISEDAEKRTSNNDHNHPQDQQHHHTHEHDYRDSQKLAQAQAQAQVQVHSRERSYGMVQRRIRLPASAEMDGTSSKLKDGVLTIRVPKKKLEDEKKRVRKIAISTSD